MTTKEQVIELAKQTGLDDPIPFLAGSLKEAKLLRFARLVRDQYRAELLEGSGEAVAWIRPSGLAMLEAGGYCTVYRSDGMSNYSAPLHTADQQAAAVLKARNQALEDAAKRCEADHQQAHTYDEDGRSTGQHSDALTCAAAIRNMKDNT